MHFFPSGSCGRRTRSKQYIDINIAPRILKNVQKDKGEIMVYKCYMPQQCKNWAPQKNLGEGGGQMVESNVSSIVLP